MPYARLDDIFPEHPKVAALSDRAFRVHVRGICYSAKVLSDGFVPFAIARGWGDKPVSELTLAGLWDAVPGGFSIHDFLDFNPSKSQVKAKRAADSERKRGGIRAESDATPRARSRAPLPTPTPPPVVGVDLDPDTPIAEGIRGEAALNGKGKNGTPFHLADVVNLGLVVSLKDRYQRRAPWKAVTEGLLKGLVLGSDRLPECGARAVNAAIDDLYSNAANVPNPAGYLRERAEAHAAEDRAFLEAVGAAESHSVANQ